MNPVVSICIPLYNPDPRHLADLFASIRQQVYRSIEICVSDDASATDATSLVAASAPDLPIRFHRNERNAGMVGNWNTVVGMARGELVLLLSQDDMLAPRAISSHVVQFDHPRVVQSATGRRLIDDEGLPAEVATRVNDRDRIFVAGHRYTLEAEDMVFLCLRNGLAFGEPSAIMYRASAFRGVGGYDPRFRHSADVDFSLRVSFLGLSRYLAQPYLLRRIHDGNLTNRHIADGTTARDRALLWERHSQHLASDASMGRVRAARASFAGIDLLRGVRHRRWRLAAASLGDLVGSCGVSPAVLLDRVGEIVTGRNRDAAFVRERLELGAVRPSRSTISGSA